MTKKQLITTGLLTIASIGLISFSVMDQTSLAATLTKQKEIIQEQKEIIQDHQETVTTLKTTVDKQQEAIVNYSSEIKDMRKTTSALVSDISEKEIELQRAKQDSAKIDELKAENAQLKKELR